MRRVDTTDRGFLTSAAYADDRHLAARQALYRWQQPAYNLPSIVLGLLVGAYTLPEWNLRVSLICLSSVSGQSARSLQGPGSNCG